MLNITNLSITTKEGDVLKIFGDPKKLAIKYELKSNVFNEVGVIGESWGQFEIIVDTAELCAYRKDSKVMLYEFNLIYLVQWLCQNFRYIIQDDPFPLPVTGKNSIELYNNSLKLEVDDEEQRDKWFEDRQNWYSRHNWFWNRSGSFLAEVYFRKVEDSIEVAWDNENTYFEDGIDFIYPKGVSYIPINNFKNTMKAFIEDFLKKLDLIIPDNREILDMREMIKRI